MSLLRVFGVFFASKLHSRNFFDKSQVRKNIIICCLFQWGNESLKKVYSVFMELKKKIHECEMLSEASRQPLSIPEKHHYLLPFFSEERRASKKTILYSWNWSKKLIGSTSMNAKCSQNSLVTKHSLSLWVSLQRSTGAEMFQWLVIFFLLASLFRVGWTGFIVQLL